MKYTDSLFAFPIKLYEGYSLKKANEKEDLIEAPVDAEWIKGTGRCYIEDIKGWHDTFSRGKTIGDVESEGFDCTAVILDGGDSFISTWNRKRFEQELNDFADKLMELKNGIDANKQE